MRVAGIRPRRPAAPGAIRIARFAVRLQILARGDTNCVLAHRWREIMIVLRFRAQCKPEQIDEALAAFREVVAPSRELPGVISFDVAQDVTDPNTVVAVEVFEDQAAVDRQEALPQVAKVMGLLPGALAAPPEATVFHVSSADSHF
jgi:quinol monooxygenase YgiN